MQKTFALGASFTTTKNMKSSIRLAHYVLRTNHLEEMKDWYCTVLQARINFCNDKIAFLTFDEEHHRVALVAMEPYQPKPDGITVGFYHAAFSFDSLDELLARYELLKTSNITPYRCINHGPTLSFYYKDRDRNDVEMQVDTLPDAEATNQWMQSEAFKNNPIGILVDPEDIIRRRRAGETEAVLLKRADV